MVTLPGTRKLTHEQAEEIAMEFDVPVSSWGAVDDRRTLKGRHRERLG